MSSIQYQLKNPSSVVDDSFVFAYPMIFDTKLHKQHEADIRNFFQIQFLNQIKNSNILKMINKKVYQSNYSGDSVPNPVENLENKLASNNKSSARNVSTTKFNKSHSYESDPYAQDNIDKVINDLYKLIKYDPKFTDLNTIIDMIPVGHSDVYVPMVIGTKVSKIQSSPLFWILYFTLGHLGKNTHATLKLNNNADLSKLKQIISQVSARNYEDYFGLPVSITNIKLSDQVDYREVSRLKSEMATGLKRFENAMNENRFMEDLSMGSNSVVNVTLSKTLDNSKQIRNSILSQANGMFGSLMANEVVPLLHSMVNMLMSADELSNASRTQIDNTNNRFNPTTISRFVEHIIGAFQSNTTTLFNKITSAIEANLIKTSRSNNNVSVDEDVFFSEFAATCNNVSNVSVENILQDISSANFSIVGASRDSVELFVEKLSKISSQLRSHINYLENDIKQLANDNTNVANFLKTYREQITANLMSFMTGMVEDWKTIGFSDRLLGILGMRSDRFNTKIFILDLIDSITSIITFLATYTYISYLCNYFSYVHATVQKTKGSAVEFPNYALVIDADIIRVLYLNLAIVNYKANVNSKGTKNVVTNTSVTEQHLINMIRTLQQKLEIPNLIVIDGNDIYYKFMFHRTNSIQKIGMGNLKSYIKHFKPSI